MGIKKLPPIQEAIQKALEPYSDVDIAITVRAKDGFKGAWWAAGELIEKGNLITPENEQRITQISSDLDKLKASIVSYLMG